MKFFFFFILCFLTGASLSFGSAPAKGVQVLALKGRPVIEKRKDDGARLTKMALKKNEKILGSAAIHTDAKSEVVLQLELGIELKVYPESEVVFPLIRWEDGRAEEFVLKHGKVRWQAQSQSQIVLKSDLFESKLSQGVFLVAYDPLTPQVQLLSLKGEIEFREKNGEENVKVGSGQKVQFLGQRENGEIAYDVLLQGRKIPKGQKSSVQDLTPEEIKLYSIEVEKNAEELRKKKSKSVGTKTSQRKNEICKMPGGIFNECRWVCENNPKEQSRCRLDLPKVRCVRSRCNANGEWAENYELGRPAGEGICKPYPVVQACDY